MSIGVYGAEALGLLPKHPDQAFWDELILRPLTPIPILSTSTSKVIIDGACILVGLAVRENVSVLGVPTFVTGAATGAASAANASLPAPGAGITNWVTGFQITGGGATAASVIVVTLTGVITGTLTYDIPVPAGITLGISPLSVSFPWPGIPASGANVAITINVPSFGAGNTASASAIEGYTVPAGAQENAGLNAAQAAFDLFNGRDTTGEPAGSFVAAPSSAVAFGPGAVGALFRRGLFLSMVSGTIKGAAFVRY